MIVHCTFFCNPEADIKWFKEKIPLNLCTIPRYTIYNHPDDLHEHTVASLVITDPSYLDNGEYIVEIKNEVGFERRTLNVMFQTEEEFNALYYEKYKQHKELFKYHIYRNGEVPWEEEIPEVREFFFYEEPEPEEPKVRKKKMKKIFDDFGEEIGEEGKNLI